MSKKSSNFARFFVKTSLPVRSFTSPLEIKTNKNN